MKPSLCKAVLISLFAISLTGCAASDDTEKKPEKEETSAKKEETKKEEKVYKIGDTWTIPDQISVTVNSISKTDERNEYYDEENGSPAAVYIVDYTYTNDGWEDKNGLMDGLFIDLSSAQIVDAGGKMAKSYPDTVTYPQSTPVGATCDAQTAIAVETEGPVKIIYPEFPGFILPTGL